MDRIKELVVSPQPEASEAGIDLLREGGNAVDAAIGCALVQGVVDPLMTGIAGFGSCGLFWPSKGFKGYIDFHSPAPLAARDDMWDGLIEGETRDGFGFVLKDRVNELGYGSIAVPIGLKGYADIHARFGKLPWADVVMPAVNWARQGWRVRQHVEQFWSDPGLMGRVPNPDRLRFTKSGKALYCRDDGSPKRVGDWVKNPEYGDLLEMIAKGGVDRFYTGDIADIIIEDMRRNGGLITKEDLSSVSTQTSAGIRGSYKDIDILTNNPPAAGTMLVEMLQVLEHFDLRSLGHNTTDYIQVVAEAMKKATADKDAFVGDPNFFDVPLDKLLSKEYAEENAREIKAGKKADVPRYRGGLPSADTTHVIAVDGDGNVVNMTHSLGAPSGVITDGLGFMYNGCMAAFDPRSGRANSIQPGKTRFTSMCPTMLFRDDRLMLAIGAPGATQIPMGVLQVILNILEFDMSMTEAVSAPRFSATGNAIDVSNRIARRAERELGERGYNVIRSPFTFGFSAVHGVIFDGDTMDAAADPGHDGVAYYN